MQTYDNINTGVKYVEYYLKIGQDLIIHCLYVFKNSNSKITHNQEKTYSHFFLLRLCNRNGEPTEFYTIDKNKNEIPYFIRES